MARENRLHFVRVLGLLVLVGGACGCRLTGKNSSSGSDVAIGPSNATPAEVRAQAMALADAYVVTIVQAMSELEKTSKRPEVIEWAQSQRVAVALAAYSDVTGPNDVGCLFDILALIKMRRDATEKHWIPTLLHEEGDPILKAEQRAETAAWGAAARVFTLAQLDELRAIIDRWQRDHPDQYYVAYVRFAGLAQPKASSGLWKGKAPSSVLGFLYLDPLAGLDPVAKELQSYRALTERIMYLATRMPTIISWQVDMRVARATANPQVMDAVSSAQTFADASDRFATAVAKYPKEFKQDTQSAIDRLHEAMTTERKAAIDQASASLTAQREAIVRDLDARESRLRQMLADVNGIVERTDQAGRSINSATSQTVTTTEQATRRTLDHAFRLALTLIIVLLLGIPSSALFYRFVRGRALFHPRHSPQ